MATSYNVFNDLLDNCASDDNNRPGRYLLEDAVLKYGGVEHGITFYVQEINIYEDIDKPGLTGWIELLDLDNLVSGFLTSASPSGKHVIVGQ